MPHDGLMSDLERVLRELARLTERLQTVNRAKGGESTEITPPVDDLPAAAERLNDADDLPGRRAS